MDVISDLKKLGRIRPRKVGPTTVALPDTKLPPLTPPTVTPPACDVPTVTEPKVQRRVVKKKAPDAVPDAVPTVAPTTSYNIIGLFKRVGGYECIEGHVHSYERPGPCPTCSHGSDAVKKVRLAIEVAIGRPLTLVGVNKYQIFVDLYLVIDNCESRIEGDCVYVKVGLLSYMYKTASKLLLETGRFRGSRLDKLL
jgi:hypothetical protein